jgi:trimethylamine--corrinoid protein Co-methyltransferase
VIDDEMIAFALRFRRGVQADEPSLALDVTREVGIAGSFLDHEHTLRHLRDELHMPGVLLRDRRSAWQGQGGRTLAQVAQQKAGELLQRPSSSPALGDDLIREIGRIINGV